MEKRYGLQLGNTFLGVSRAGKVSNEPEAKSHQTIQPFTENIESGMPYRITGTSIQELLSILHGTFSDRTLIELFGCMGEIFAPVHAIASRVVSASFTFRKKKDDSVIEGNELLDKLLTQPNPFQNFYELLYEAIVYQTVLGKEFFYSRTPSTLPRVNYQNIIASYNLPADRITIETPERIKLFTATKLEDVIINYILDKDTTDEMAFPVSNVLYRKDINMDWSAKKIEGRAKLLSAAKAIANLIAVYEARNVVYVKRGAMGAWVSRKGDNSGFIALSAGEKKALRKEADENLGIVGRNKDTFMILSEPVDFIKSSMSIAELMPFEETKADAAVIYGVLEVPYELAPKPEGETYENQKTAEKGLYQNKIIPLTNNWTQSLTNFWGINEGGIYLHADFSHIELLQEDKSDQANRDSKNGNTWLQQFTNGLITLNDWIAKIGGKASTNPLYTKLLYDMSDSEREIVKEILNIQKPNNVQDNSQSGSNSNTHDDNKSKGKAKS